MMGWIWYALWLEMCAEIMWPEPAQRAACPVVNLADWRRDHPKHDGYDGWAA